MNSPLPASLTLSFTGFSQRGGCTDHHSDCWGIAFFKSNGQALWSHASTKLHYVQRQHPFAHVQLKDEDVKVDLAELNSPQDCLVIVVTEPLTTNEDWVAMQPGEFQVFVDGRPLPT